MKNRKTVLPTAPCSVGLFDGDPRNFPFAQLSPRVLADVVVTTPDYDGGGRSDEDRKRHKDRIKDSAKPQLPKVIGENPIFGDGKIRVPVKGGYEPKIRHGRNPKGGGGGGDGKPQPGQPQPGQPKPGQGQGPAGGDEADLVYVEFDFEEVLKMYNINLPDLLKKAASLVRTTAQRFRGTVINGPKSRLKKLETGKARVRRAIGIKNANPERFADSPTPVPSTAEVPFAKRDRRYHKVAEMPDDDTNAVVFLLLDQSVSMSGDPLFWSKIFFKIALMCLRHKYKRLRFVMVAHNAKAFRVENEVDFFKVDVAGGTGFVPAYNLVQKIADEEFPASLWNRYLLHATDGENYEAVGLASQVIVKMLDVGRFTYFGYFEAGKKVAWEAFGKELLALPAKVKAKIGMTKATKIEDVVKAIEEIFVKDMAK
jgi:uncharacterized sporulation protein YeaH/YhbH (DUF444 family)